MNEVRQRGRRFAPPGFAPTTAGAELGRGFLEQLALQDGRVVSTSAAGDDRALVADVLLLPLDATIRFLARSKRTSAAIVSVGHGPVLDPLGRAVDRERRRLAPTRL